MIRIEYNKVLNDIKRLKANQTKKDYEKDSDDGVEFKKMWKI